MITYPAGTRLGDIRVFDRSTKIAFTCLRHNIGTWHSKDPFVSHWFPDHTIVDAVGTVKPEYMDPNECGKTCTTGSLVTTEPYTA